MVDYNSDQYGPSITRPGNAANTVTLFGQFNITTALAPADTINLFTMPAGFTYLHGFVYGQQLDTNGTPTLDFNVGIPTDTDFFGNLGVVGGAVVNDVKPEASIWMPLGGSSRVNSFAEFTTDTDVLITVVAAAATAAAGNIAVYMTGVMNDSRIVN